MRNDRGLYGAKLHYETPGVTPSGDAKAMTNLYAATPETLPQRDVLTGTGGSAYLLSRQDINGGSETVVVEVVDPVTGRVISRRQLVAAQDYTIDYLQGVVLLRVPLSSSATTGGIITDGPSGGNQVRLITQYEYTPALGSLDGAALGGRATYWVNDALRIGVTAMRETTGSADQRMGGADLEYRIGETSKIIAEIATAEGPGFARSISSDGGSSGALGTRALAYKVSGNFELRDLGMTQNGAFGFYAERKEAGFSTLSEDVVTDETLFGVYGRIDATDRVTLAFDTERFERQNLEKKAEVAGSVAQIARDFLRDSKVLVGFHEQTHIPDLPHDELALLSSH